MSAVLTAGGMGMLGVEERGMLMRKVVPSSALVWQDHSPVRSSGRLLEAEE